MAGPLLDTHVLIWALSSPARIAPSVRAQLEDGRNHLYVSAASTWEMAIKVALGKLRLPPSLQTWLPDRLTAAQITELPVTVQHTLVVEQLPMHHNDPFDRLLIAQSLADGLTLVTADPLMALYQVPLLRA